MGKYIIEESTSNENNYIDDEIIKYNDSKVPFLQKPTFISINRVIKGPSGEILAGIMSVLYCWNCLNIDILWVKEAHRCDGYGSALLFEVEKIAKEKGCSLVHLDTFDFQAKEFYEKNGYEVFGKLEDCPTDHIRYYMKKIL